MLTPWRRHFTGTEENGKPLCSHAHKGRAYTKCNCPIWADGELRGKRYRKSLDTRDWARAIRKLAELEDPNAPRLKPITEATEAFRQHCCSLATGTKAKYWNVLRHLEDYAKRAGLHDLSDITLERLDAYRAGRRLSPVASLKELQTLRQFFGFCFERRWIQENPAKKVKVPRNIKPNEVVPYKADEIQAMVQACNDIGRGPYERLRARALMLLLRHTGLRITDAVTLARDRIRDGQMLLHTQKTGGTVYLPVADELQAALDALPVPRGAGSEPRYFLLERRSPQRGRLRALRSALWPPCLRSRRCRRPTHIDSGIPWRQRSCPVAAQSRTPQTCWASVLPSSGSIMANGRQPGSSASHAIMQCDPVWYICGTRRKGCRYPIEN